MSFVEQATDHLKPLDQRQLVCLEKIGPIPTPHRALFRIGPIFSRQTSSSSPRTLNTSANRYRQPCQVRMAIKSS